MELSLFFFLAVFLGISSNTSNAFNITKILEKQSDFTNFNNLLSETKLADQINSRSTITILAVDNSGVGGLSGRPSDLQKKILSVHVVLDYYDSDKLKKLFKSNKSTTLTTMFQSTGLARNQQGFITVSVKDGQISFASAAKGGQNSNSVNLVKSVVSQPYNISVLQVGSIIDVPDIDSSAPASAPIAKSPSPSKSKSKDKDDDGAPSPSDDDSPPSEKAPAPSKSHKGHDKSSPPVSADSSSDSTAPTPSAPAPSAASRTREIVRVGAWVVIMGLASILVA